VKKEPNLIKGLKWEAGKDSVTWSFGSTLVEKHARNIKSALTDSQNQFVLVLFYPDCDSNQTIVEYTGHGVEVFQISPPDEYSFYYLSPHHKATISVVCQGPADPFGRTDYHFSIDTGSGSLKLLGLAH